MKHLTTFLSIILSTFCLSALAQDSVLPSPDELMEKFRNAESGVKNYSYTAHRLDIADDYVKVRHTEGLKAYEKILNALKRFDRNQEVKPETEGYMTTHSQHQFVKPLKVQLLLDVNDYVPGYLQGSRIFYGPDINPGEIFLKEPNIGLVLRNGVKDDSAVSLIINWTYDLIEIDCVLANGGTPEVTGSETFYGKTAYVMDIALNKGEIPWEMGCGGKSYDVPKEAQVQLNRELSMLEYRMDQDPDIQGILRIWFDAESGLLLGKNFIFGEVVTTKYWIENIVLDKVDTKKMLKAKKPKKGLW